MGIFVFDFAGLEKIFQMLLALKRDTIYRRPPNEIEILKRRKEDSRGES